MNFNYLNNIIRKKLFRDQFLTIK